MTKGPVGKYAQNDMEACLLEWCMCADPCMNLDSILQSHRIETGKVVRKTTLYKHFAKRVDLGTEFGGLTSLKDTQATIRDHWLKNSSSSSYDSVLLVHKIQVQSIIKKIFENKDVNQTAQRKDLAESKRLLTVEEEAYLVQLCKLLAKSGHGLDRDKVLTCFNLIAPSTVGSHSQKAVDRFFKRNPDIKLKGSSGIDPLRASQANEYVRDTFFFKLDALVGQLYAMGLIKWKTFAEIPSKFIYNMDELASDTTQRRNKIAADSESNVRNYTITPEGDRMPFHVTVCLSTRADGQYICPADEI